MRFRDRFDRSKRKKATTNQRIGFAFFWLVVLAYAYVIPIKPNFNSESHLYPAFALVNQHTLSIDRYQTRLEDKSFYRGHYYSDKAPGLSFLAVPVYALLKLAFPGKPLRGYTAYSHFRYSIPRDTVYLRYATTYLLLILPSALFSTFLWLFLMSISGRRRWSLLVAAAYALGTLAFPYSVQFFSHQIAAILVFAAFMVLYRLVRYRAANRGSYGGAALAGLLIGYAVISEYPTVILAVLLGIYALVVSRPRVLTGICMIAGSLPALALGGAYNTAAFGQPLETGYNYVHSAVYHSHISGGAFGFANPSTYGIRMPTLDSLWQITFGTYRGIFLVSPVLLLVVPGLWFMWRQREARPELWLCLGAVVLYFLMDAARGVDQNGWSGGVSVASRHLTPMLPFMMMPVVYLFESRRARVAFGILAAASTIIMFTTVTSVLEFSFADRNPLVHEMVPAFFQGHLQINWGALLAQTGLRSLIPFFALATALTARLAWLLRSGTVSAKDTASIGPSPLIPDDRPPVAVLSHR